MPSIKPKIQGYVEEEIFQAFQQWKAEEGIEGMSDALNELFKRFFGFEKPVPAAGGLGKEEIEALIDAKLTALYTWARFAEEKINKMEWRLKMEPEESLMDSPQSPLEESGVVEESKGDCGESPFEEEAPQEPEEEPPLSSLEQEDLETNPLPIPPQSPVPLTGLKQSELERRLQIAKGTLTKRRNRDDFKDWSRGHDPNGEEESPLDSPQSPLIDENKNNWKVGDKLTDSLGSLAEIIELNAAGLRVNWLGGTVPNPPTGKGIWYDWIRDKEIITQLEVIALASKSPLSSLEQEDLEANPLPTPPQSPVPLTGLKQLELERRLQIAKGTLTKRRNRDDFKEWSRGHDPDGIAWQWDPIARKYLAVE